MPMTLTPNIGDRVSYEDMANPKAVGTVTASHESRWGTDYTVTWDDPSRGDLADGTSRCTFAQHGWNLEIR